MRGQYGKPGVGFEEFGKNVGKLAEAADDASERLAQRRRFSTFHL